MEEYILHTNEVEILLPEKINKSNSMPLILSIGPTLTMAVPILLMVIVSSRVYGGNNKFVYMTLITGTSACLLGVIWGLSNYFYKNRAYKLALAKKDEEFKRYLSLTKEYLDACKNDNKRYLLNKYKSSHELVNLDDPSYMYKRYILDEDFLFLRTKLGKIDFQMKVKISDNNKEMFPSEDKIKAQKLAKEYEFLEGVPVGVNLSLNRYLGIVCEDNNKQHKEALLNILVQLVYYHSPKDLKLIYVYDEEIKSQLEIYEVIKWFPHFLSESGEYKYFIGNSKHAQEVLPTLTNELQNNNKYLLLVVLNDKYIKDETVYLKLINAQTTQKVAVILANSSGSFPNIFKNYVNLNDDINIETINEVRVDELQRKVMLTNESNATIPLFPNKVDFYDLYDAKEIKDIDIINNWNYLRPKDRIKVPIGKTYKSQKIYLDIHEKFHGPHGLIAGTTGSGKSELIQTFIMSLCISFSPRDINFFLIDYKGGGTGQKISSLVHCAGCISNLSGSQINRSLKAISAENTKRQKMLSLAGVNHIDAYQNLFYEGKVSTSMPHLILIIDEFAELKKEEPEFMKQIISLAAVGRSLGIHLILATQKPSGVVDDKIWSNSNFKLCLRVQDKQDSMDMLHRPEAAYLTSPGQGYIQIGNDEYFEKFQTGYCGGVQFIGEDNEDAICLVEPTGLKIALESGNEYHKSVDKLEYMVNYINQLACDNGYEACNKLWMDELKENIALEDIKEQKDSKNIVLGRYDDPANQRQPLMKYNPLENGNLCVIGGPVTGKSTLLKTIISQIEYPDEYLLIDVSQSDIMEYEYKKECLGSLSGDYGMAVFFYHLKREYLKRKSSPTNRLFIIIDNFLALLKCLKEEELDILLTIINEGARSSIYVIASGNSISDIGVKVFNKLKTTMALELNDRFAYGDVLRKYHLTVYPKANIPGRCLYKLADEVYEGQIAIAMKESVNMVPLSNDNRFLKLDENVDLDTFIIDALKIENKTAFIGYSLRSGRILGIEYNRGSFLIVGENLEASKSLLNNIKMTYMSVLNVNEASIFDCYEGIDISDFMDSNHKYLFIDDLECFVNCLENANNEEVFNKVNSIIKGEITGCIFAVVNNVNDALISINPMVKQLIDYNQGICLGGNVINQRYLSFKDLGYSQSNQRLSYDEGFMRIHQKERTYLIKIPGMKKEGDMDDFD